MHINPHDNTHSLVLLMVLISNFRRSSSWFSVPCLHSLLRLGVGTAVWYLFARVMFPYVEHITGVWYIYILYIIDTTYEITNVYIIHIPCLPIHIKSTT